MQPTVYFVTDHQIDTSLIDRDAINVVHRLREAGFSAYLVGGSVRDLLLKKTPKDYDISTSAKPEEIKRLFGRQCILIGRRFRLAHIRFGHKILEVATFRSGDTSEDLITHDNVWGTEQQDVMRRDFTINGLFYDPENQSVIDYVNGWKDLQEHTLHTIGTPEVRFRQDPVRMIRLLKFQARFDFKVSSATHEGLVTCMQEITKSSPARVLEEMFKMLESCAAAPFFRLMLSRGMMQALFPPLADAFLSSKGEAMFRYLEAVDEINKKSSRFPIERPVLTAALLYPLLENEIHTHFLSQNKTPHLGEVISVSGGLIRDLILPSFYHFPRRISALMSYVLTTQYRLTPLKSKRPHPIRLFRTREFPLALRLLKIRALVDSSWQETYVNWRENYRHFLRQEDQHHHPHPGPNHRHQAKHEQMHVNQH